MTFRIVLPWLLPLLAVLSLALAPVTASAATAGMRGPMPLQGHAMATATEDIDGMAEMAMDAMPCCPHEDPAAPDCSKGCPLMALCVAKVATGLPNGFGLPARVAVTRSVAWTLTSSFDSLSSRPPPEPPRS